MSQAQISSWTDEANALPVEEVRPPVAPVFIVLAEAAQVAQVVDKYWEATPERPGLESTNAFMPKSIAGDIVSLVEAARTVHMSSLFSERGDAASKAARRAREVIAELTAALEFVLEDGRRTSSVDALAVMKTRAGSSDTVAQRAQSLVDFATLAEREQSALQKLGGLDLGLIAEARKLASDLLGTQASPGRTASEAVQLRDRLLVLLNRKVLEVRRTVRYVFRSHPDIQKLATSRYERKRRAAQRKGNGTATTVEVSAPVG